MSDIDKRMISLENIINQVDEKIALLVLAREIEKLEKRVSILERYVSLIGKVNLNITTETVRLMKDLRELKEWIKTIC